MPSETHSDIIYDLLLLNQSNKSIFASFGNDKTIKIWNISSGELLRTLKGHASWVKCIILVKNDDLLASGSNDRKIRIWNLTQGLIIRNFTGHTDSVHGMIG